MSHFAAQLSQTHPLTVGAVTAFSASYLTEITRFEIANCHSATAVYSLFHNDSGNSYSRGNAIQYETQVFPNTTVEKISDEGGFGVNRNGTIGFQSSGTAYFTLTIYGASHEVR